MAESRTDGGGDAVSKGGTTKGSTAVATGSGSVETAGDDETRVATKSNTPGRTDLEDLHIQGKDEKANTNDEALGDDDLLEDIDPLDKGATQEPDTGHWEKVDDNAEPTGPTPEMRFPLLDVEPNSITSLNTDEWSFTLKPRVHKPTINYESLAYESVVGNLAGHKRAYNSSEYGKLDPEVHIAFEQKADTRKVWKIDSESIQDSLAESPFGFRKTNENLANDFKSSMRTYVMANSHYHGGPTMLKRGLNQFRNVALRKQGQDPNPENVEQAVQNARDAFVLNDQVLYANNNTKLQFKTTFNGARVNTDSGNTGHIPVPTNWFGVQQGTSAQRTFGYGVAGANSWDTGSNPAHRLSGTAESGGKFYQGVPQLSAATAPTRPSDFAPTQPNTGPYATFSTTSFGGVPPSVAQPATMAVANRTMGS